MFLCYLTVNPLSHGHGLTVSEGLFLDNIVIIIIIITTGRVKRGIESHDEER